MSRAARVHVHIDTLAVTGLRGFSRAALADAVQQQLQHGLAAHVDGLAQQQNAHHAHIDGGDFRVRPAAGSRELGGQIAAAIQRGIATP